MNMRVLIIDDEEPARKELVYLLSKIPSVELIGDVGSGQEALELLKSHFVDMVFLDIHMPEQDGFNVAEKLKSMKSSPYVIFATAYDEYALQAFGTQAVGYLLKPFTLERVQRAIEKVRVLHSEKHDLAHLTDSLERIRTTLHREQNLQKIPVDFRGRILLIDHKDIVMVKSQEGETFVYTAKETYKVNLSLYEVEERLASLQFFRSHRSCIVNLQKIKEIVPWFNGTLNLILDDVAEEVPVSRNQAVKLKKILGM